MQKQLKILVIGDDTRSFLAVVRSLGRAGHTVHVIMHQPNKVSGASRYIHTVHALAPLALNISNWLRKLETLQEEENFDLIVPCDDAALLPLILEKHSLDLKIVAHPGERAFDTFYDKRKTIELSEKVGVPTAKTAVISECKLDSMTYPIVIKPSSSFTTDSLVSKRSVVVAKSAKEATACLEAISDDNDWYFEEFFDGVGVGVSVLAKSGAVTHAFQHERMEEGVSGGSSLRKSVAVNEALLSDVRKLAEAAGLNGVAMFEFRVNQHSGKYILLEVNARFWGSLPLAVYAGVDFPRYLVEMYQGVILDQKFSYKNGKVARSLTASFYHLARNIADRRTVWGKLSLGSSLVVGVARVLLFREKIDTFAFDDVRPFLREITSILALVKKGLLNRLGLRKHRRDRQAKADISTANALKADTKNILILCYGNICRSPFAEKKLSELLSDEKCQVVSAGFHLIEGRNSPTEAQKVALEQNVDLSQHQSKFATSEMVDQADLIVLFDELNAESLSSWYPEAVDRSVNLGSFLSDPSDIEDPYGKGEAKFTICYEQIAQASKVLSGYIRGLK